MVDGYVTTILSCEMYRRYQVQEFERQFISSVSVSDFAGSKRTSNSAPLMTRSDVENIPPPPSWYSSCRFQMTEVLQWVHRDAPKATQGASAWQVQSGIPRNLGWRLQAHDHISKRWLMNITWKVNSYEGWMWYIRCVMARHAHTHLLLWQAFSSTTHCADKAWQKLFLVPRDRPMPSLGKIRAKAKELNQSSPEVSATSEGNCGVQHSLTVALKEQVAQILKNAPFRFVHLTTCLTIAYTSCIGARGIWGSVIFFWLKQALTS